MVLQTLNKATVAACIECIQSKVDVDVYKSGDLYAHKKKSLRNSSQYEKRCSYEKGKVKVIDKSGKVVIFNQDTESLVKKPAKPKKDKEVKKPVKTPEEKPETDIKGTAEE